MEDEGDATCSAYVCGECAAFEVDGVECEFFRANACAVYFDITQLFEYFYGVEVLCFESGSASAFADVRDVEWLFGEKRECDGRSEYLSATFKIVAVYFYHGVRERR